MQTCCLNPLITPFEHLLIMSNSLSLFEPPLLIGKHYAAAYESFFPLGYSNPSLFAVSFTYSGTPSTAIPIM